MATRQIETLTLAGAKVALEAAEKKAKEMGVDTNIAIVGQSTHLLAFSRMDNAKLTSIDTAIDKAFTAAGHWKGTHTYKEAVWPGGAAYGLGTTNGGRFTTMGGGLPILGKGDVVLGGIGCSSGTPAQDQEVAQAGIDALLKFQHTNYVGKAKL
eukprot:Phypoly_transcript_22542.p1 GENE.Phypoly_transcript_22542~~Phypoly_transcript_22542.p1  ORF type:complete len:154 (+),score=31.22 Phypoly_transcript_22542:103-564(+)